MSAPSQGGVVFRCNVSASVGIGHLMRCREVARHLRAANIASVILGPPESLRCSDDAVLFEAWHPVDSRGSSEEDAARVVDLCRAFGTRHVVIDDYRADPPFQKALRRADLRWLQQFDTSCPWEFYCDLLVSAGPLEKRADYLPYLVDPARTETLLGPAYAVLRPEFRALEGGATIGSPGHPVRKVFVGFGGGDDRGALALAITALAGRLGEGVSLVLVSGTANPHRHEIARIVDALPPGQAELHVGPADVARLMVGCDLAVISGGTMSYEAAFLGLPMVLVGLASNQERSCRGWEAHCGAWYLGQVGTFTVSALHYAVLAIVRDPRRRRYMAEMGRALVDGKGVDRLTDALLKGAHS